MTSGGDFDMVVQVHLAKKSGTFDIKKKFLIIRFVLGSHSSILRLTRTYEQKTTRS